MVGSQGYELWTLKEQLSESYFMTRLLINFEIMLNQPKISSYCFLLHVFICLRLKVTVFNLIIRRNLVQIVRCLKKKKTVTDKALEMNPCLTEIISESVRAINIYWQFNYFFH